MKKFLSINLVLCLLLSTISFGGAWEQTGGYYKYKRDDGTYVVNAWEWIDTDNDGIAQCFYFNATGLMLSNTTTPDGCQVNVNGEWIQNGLVQTKQVGTQQSSTLYAPDQSNNSFTAGADGDFNVPGSTSSESAKKALESLKAKCNNLVTKLAAEGKRDMKQNSWDTSDITAMLENYRDEADLYLDEYELKVDLIMIQYNLPAARKDVMMKDGRGAIAQGRATLSSKLHQALSKNKD